MQKAITNTTPGPMYVAGRMIPPGETLVFDEADLPPEHREEAAPPMEEIIADPVVELAEQNAKEVIAALEALPDEDLARLKAIESDGKQRKTVLEAIDALMLDRAALALDADKTDPEGKTTPEGAGE